MIKIEDFNGVHTIVDGFKPLEAKFLEYDYIFDVLKPDPDGLHMELGVWFGASLNYMANKTPDVHWHGFDTFEGIEYTWNTGGKIVDMKRFKVKDPNNIDPATGLPKVPSNVSLYKGMFEDTLPGFVKEHNKDTISFLNMDPDIYPSTIYSLRALDKMIVEGTIIRFDELSDFRLLKFQPGPKNGMPIASYTTWQEGEWKALLEWCEECNREVKPLWRNWHQSAGVVVTR